MNEPARLSHIDERLFPSLKPLSGNALVGVLIQRKRSTTNELTTRRVSPRFQMKIGEVIHHYEDSDLLIVQYRDGSREVLTEHEVKEFALPGNADVMMGYDKPSLRTKRGSSSSTEASGKPSDESPSKAVIATPGNPRVDSKDRTPPNVAMTPKPLTSSATARASRPSKKRKTSSLPTALLETPARKSSPSSSTGRSASPPIFSPDYSGSPGTDMHANDEVQILSPADDAEIVTLEDGDPALSRAGALNCYYNPLFVKHIGVGPDTAGQWLRHSILALRPSINTGRVRLITKPSARVSIKDIAAVGVHSEAYLQGLGAVDKWLKGKSHELKREVVLDLCSDACRDIMKQATGRKLGLALSPRECIMDRHTLDVGLLSCGMMRDALIELLGRRDCYDGGRSERAPKSTLVLTRTTGHQVPVFLGPEDERVISEHLRCESCDRSTDESKMLVCDNDACQRGYHIGCLSPPLSSDVLKDPNFSEQQWFCPHCEGNILHADEEESDSESEAENELLALDLDLNKHGGPMNVKPGDEVACGGHFINSVAFAIKSVRASRRVSRVAILDFGLYHGCGNEWLFYRDPSVLTMSLHRYGRNRRGETILPGTGSHKRLGEKCALGKNINLEVPAGWGDFEYVSSVREILIPILQQYRPEAIVLVTTFDTLDSSNTQRCYLSRDADLKLTPGFFEWLPWAIRTSLPEASVLASVEGGYDPLRMGEVMRCFSAGLAGPTGGKGAPVEFEKATEEAQTTRADWEAHVSPQVRLYRSAGWKLESPSASGEGRN